MCVAVFLLHTLERRLLTFKLDQIHKFIANFRIAIDASGDNVRSKKDLSGGLLEFVNLLEEVVLNKLLERHGGFRFGYSVLETRHYCSSLQRNFIGGIQCDTGPVGVECADMADHCRTTE